MKWDELTDEQKCELVHEKVFGWEPTPCLGPSLGKITRDEDPLNKVGTPRGLWHCSLCQYLGCGDESSYPHNKREDIPDYSTDMNEAWKVLQAMTEHEYKAEFANLLYLEVGPLVPDDIPRHQFAVRRVAQITSETICKAALIAVRAIEG